jgi:pimeloyl-ACP methyl ester carboxylesterase
VRDTSESPESRWCTIDGAVRKGRLALRRIRTAGFSEKQVALDDGTVLNYGEGPDNGPALLPIHGQTVTWQDYANALPELSRHFHVFAVDCHGHGKSSKNPAKYSAESMGHDFSWFVAHVVGGTAIVSGHSSGGLLAAWLAANSPNSVRGVVLEDPPFFATETGRQEKTFAWIDRFEPTHRFFGQTEEKDYVLYYLAHSYWRSFFGSGWDGIVKYAASYRLKHPNEKLRVFFLPLAVNRIWEGIPGSYDPRFALTFYDNSSFEGFDQAETLSRVNCPSVLIHTSVS